MLDRRQVLATAAAFAGVAAGGGALAAGAPAAPVVRLSEQRNRFLLDVALNRGAGFRFVLDTGATTHFVSSRVVEQLRLPRVDVRTVRGFSGRNEDPVVGADRLNVGGLDLGAARLVEWPAERLDQFDGLIGYPFLFPRAVIALGEGRITLGAPAAGEPFTPVKAQVTRADAMLLGGLPGAEGRFAFDTGARACTISPAYHARIADLPAYQGAVKLVYRTTDGQSRTAAFRAPMLRFGDFTIADAVVGIAGADGREGVFHEADALLGVSLMRPYAWALDQGAGTLRVAGAQPARQPLFGSGLQLRRDGEAATVTGVQEGGPAHEAGIRPGDRLRSIADAPPARWSRWFRDAAAPRERSTEQMFEVLDGVGRRRVRFHTRELL